MRKSLTSKSAALLAVLLCILILSSRAAQTQSGATAQPAPDTRPLPDIPTLLLDIRKNQTAIEDLRKNYTCHLSEEQDKTDSDGNIKSRELKDYDVFYIGDEQVLHLLAKDGKPLDDGEKQKEDDRFNKRYDKLKKEQAELAADPKKQAKKDEQDEAQLSDFLRAETFTNPRREMFRGHEVIAFDFAGNPNYKPKKEIDRIIQKLAGVMWVDEQAREIARLEGHFAESAKVGGGLLASVHKGSNFVFEQEKINDEVWLPSYAEVHLSARVVFVSLKQNFIDRYSDYKKFRTGVTLGPVVPN
ncbi:MAG TPA: hypothetical protein VMB02_07210 [Candidatus Aquilonibacter sp.]|nr:hypothetical protein [Candidatus Aquilonibacter sp.]